MAEVLERAAPITRLDSLTGLRWWAAFGVFCHHMTNLAALPIYGALALGDYGVMFFFVLSGFVLTWSASRSTSAQTFWVRRFSRIYPAHFVALLLAIPIFYSFMPDSAQTWVKPVNFGILALSLVVIQGWWNQPNILFSGNPAAWTLSCEAFFYALHPFVNRVLRAVSMRATFVIGLAIIALDFATRASLIAWPDSFLDSAPLPLTRLSEFVLGMCAAHAMRLGWRPRIRPITLYIIGFLFVCWLAISPGRINGGAVGAFLTATANEWFIVLCVMLIIAVAVRDVRGGASILRWKPLVILGEWSYSFYLVHATVIYLVIEIVGKRQIGWSNLLWYAALLAASIACAAALHYLVEKPCEQVLRAWWSRRMARRSAHQPEIAPASPDSATP